jgi:hypothetical protein
MNALTSRARAVLTVAAPGLKKFALGALIGGVSVFVLATFAMGFFAGLYGVPVPQLNASELEAAASDFIGTD